MTPSTTASDFRAAADATLSPQAQLFVVMNCANPLAAPSRHILEGVAKVHIGRGSQSEASRRDGPEGVELTLALADRLVSSNHARLLRRDDAWTLEDLGSKNGSSVNGTAVRSTVLADGDCLLLGHTILVFRAALPTPPNAPMDLVATAGVPAFATLIPHLAARLDHLSMAAASTVPILLVSETGTGKELLARAVHALSCRSGDFVAVNCGGLPAALVESVLFGHKRGAFSGAVADQPGLFRAATSGTLLLDEVGDMPTAAQAAVLRALQNGEVLPVGATQPLHVDVRVISATHRDLEACVAAGRFREDLLARLSGFTFRLPPLRERREDLGLLVGVLLRSMVAKQGYAPALSPEVGMALLRYAWPRNVRELEKGLAHALALAGGGRVEVEHLPEAVRNGGVPARMSPDDELRERLLSLLREHAGNVSMVAASLHTSRSQLHRWMKRFGLVAEKFRT